MHPALLARFCDGTSVGRGLSPGLACGSADAASAVLGIDLPIRPGGLAPTGGAVLICLSCSKRPGFTGPAASGCVRSLNHRKGMT